MSSTKKPTSVMCFILTGVSFLFIGFSVYTVFILFSPGLLEFEPTSFRFDPPPSFTGKLKVNTKLDNVEKLFENRINGPEAIEFYKGAIYTGLLDGRIVKIEGENIETVAQFGKKDCEGLWEEDLCGRPLGLRFLDDGQLYAADAYYGLFKVDVNTGDIKTLYSSKDPVNGRPSKVINDFDISKSGVIYFTDSSKFSLSRGVLTYLEASPSGRLLKYDPSTDKVEQVLDGLTFANGVQLSKDEDFVLIAESTLFRITKFHLKGPKQGTTEIFMKNLPGMPDNIRPTPRNTYWIGQCTIRGVGKVGLLEKFSDQPLIRKFMARTLDVVQNLLKFVIEHFYGPVFLKEIEHKVTHLSAWAELGAPKYGLIIEIDNDGNIVNSLHSPKGEVMCISEITEHEGQLYLGSPWHKFIGKVPYS